MTIFVYVGLSLKLVEVLSFVGHLPALSNSSDKTLLRCTDQKIVCLWFLQSNSNLQKYNACGKRIF